MRKEVAETVTIGPPKEAKDLPEPPKLTLKEYFIYLGPTIVAIGLGIGSGELLLGPAASVRYGLSILWIATLSAFFQAALNLEFIRYTIATGEPAIVGYMRTFPGSKFYGILYSALILIQLGWPYLAFLTATALASAQLGRLAGDADKGLVIMWGYITWAICILIMLFGGRILRAIEAVNWVAVLFIFGSFVLATIMFASPEKIVEGFKGLFSFGSLPEGADWLLLGSVAGYTGIGGMANVVLSSWYKDKGFGMGKLTGYIPSMIGGKKIVVSTLGYSPADTVENANRFRRWFRWAWIDQWGVFMWGSMFSILLPSIVLSSLLKPGTEVKGFGVAAIYADATAKIIGIAGWIWMLLVAFWVLFSSQISVADLVTRQITEILWAGSSRLRAWANNDIRRIYYLILLIYIVWGGIVINIGQPLIVAMLAGNIANLAFFITGIHQLYINHKLLPKYARPSLIKLIVVIAGSIFFMIFFILFLLRQAKLI
ncbi:MAG: Nramp family divalent metal transporter [Desulfurococcales archaeon]|nr:Nramp family divalent metal transporter [Desulfurococcales archaeon]